MINLTPQLTLPALFMFLWGCSGGNGDRAALQGNHEPGLVDSVVCLEEEADAEPVPEPEVVKPRIDLSTTQLQLAHMRASDSWLEYEQGILPQMAEDAPDYCRQILESDGKRFIVVDKAKMKLFLYDPYGNIEKSFGIACAKNYGTKHKKGDSRTTEGAFKVKGVFDSTNWLFTDDNGYTSPVKGQYGPRFIRLNIPYIGIHGTGSPKSIGKRCSHGCIRVTNDNILDLVKYVEEGMTVIISPGPRDMAVNKKEGYDILAVVSEPGGSKAKPGWDSEKKPEQPKEETKQPEEPLPETETTAPTPGAEETGSAPAPVSVSSEESEIPGNQPIENAAE